MATLQKTLDFHLPLEESIISPPFQISPPTGTEQIWGSGVKSLRLPEEEVSERVVEKEIDVDSLGRAIDATDEEVNRWLGLLLEDYDFEPTAESIERMSFLIRAWLGWEASKRNLKLKQEEQLKLFKFAVRLAYEVLYVGSV